MLRGQQTPFEEKINLDTESISPADDIARGFSKKLPVL